MGDISALASAALLKIRRCPVEGVRSCIPIDVLLAQVVQGLREEDRLRYAASRDQAAKCPVAVAQGTCCKT